MKAPKSSMDTRDAAMGVEEQDYAALTQTMHGELAPKGPFEIMLVDMLIQGLWIRHHLERCRSERAGSRDPKAMREFDEATKSIGEIDIDNAGILRDLRKARRERRQPGRGKRKQDELGVFLLKPAGPRPEPEETRVAAKQTATGEWIN